MGSYSRQETRCVTGKSRLLEQTWWTPKFLDHNNLENVIHKKSIGSLESLMRYKGSGYKLVILPMSHGRNFQVDIMLSLFPTCIND